MRVLGIDTSSSATACGIFDWEKSKESPFEVENIEGIELIENDRSGAEEMISVIEKLLKKVQLAINDIDAFAVITGPGSFTGIRIGLTMAKTMAQFAKKPLVGISSLRALAAGKHEEDYLKVPIIDARSNRIFAACFEGDWQLKELLKEDLYYEEDFIYRLNDLIKNGSYSKVIFCGLGIDKHRAMLDEADFEYKIDQSEYRISPIPQLLHLAAARLDVGDFDSYLELKANYLRKSQAELERDKRKND